MGPTGEEPTIATRVTLETLEGDRKVSHPATIADLTRNELWVAIDKQLTHQLDPGRQVRLVLEHPKRPTQTADTIVLWHLGKNGNVVVLKRPLLWDPPSRREHSRVTLSVPVYLRADEGAAPVPTMSTNISVGGMFCVAAIDLIVMQTVDVAIQLTPNQVFDCKAEVARIDKDPEDPTGTSRLIGLKFLGLAQDDQAALASTLAELASDVDVNFVPRPWRPEALDAGADELSEQTA